VPVARVGPGAAIGDGGALTRGTLDQQVTRARVLDLNGRRAHQRRAARISARDLFCAVRARSTARGKASDAARLGGFLNLLHTIGRTAARNCVRRRQGSSCLTP